MSLVDVTAATAPSPHALRLGYAGLLPFVAGAALIWIVRADAHPYVAAALSAYAAVNPSGVKIALPFGFGPNGSVASPPTI